MKTRIRLALVALLALVVNTSPVRAQSTTNAVGPPDTVPVVSAMSVHPSVPKYVNSSIGFEFEYKVDHATACVAWPENLQNSGCNGLDYHNLVEYSSAFNAANGPLIQSMAYLRFENDCTATINVGHLPSAETVISQERIDRILEGMLAGIHDDVPATLTMSGSVPGSRYDTMEINGVGALRVDITADARMGSPGYARSRGIGYIFFGKHGQVIMTATTDPQHIRQTRQVMESIVATVHLPPMPRTAFDSKPLWIVWYDNILFEPFLLVVVVTGLVSVHSYFWRRQRNKRLRAR